MVLYGITLVLLAEEVIVADQGLLSPFYADAVTFDVSVQQSTQLLNLLMKRGPDREYFTEPAKSLFILDTPGQEEAAKKGFALEGLTLNFVSVSWCIGAYLGPQ